MKFISAAVVDWVCSLEYYISNDSEYSIIMIQWKLYLFESNLSQALKKTNWLVKEYSKIRRRKISKVLMGIIINTFMYVSKYNEIQHTYLSK